MKLTSENYFSGEAMAAYMSYSQFKKFEECEAAAYANIVEDKACFIEGHFFEALLNDTGSAFVAQHPEMCTKKGTLYANFERIVASAEAISRQPVLMSVFDRCEEQVILTGEIAGVPFKGCIDLFDRETLNAYDTKCVRDFKPIWSEAERSRLSWYFAWGYQYQAAIYRELIRQNFGSVGKMHLIAATKEPVPDVGFYQFDDEILDGALSIIETYAPKYQAIKDGKVEPTRCECCDYCKSTRFIKEPVIIEEFK